MPNAPAENTVSTSFTLPRELMHVIESRAKSEGMNKSELIRRALLNYLSAEERAHVLNEMRSSSPSRAGSEKSVSYRKDRSRKGKR